MEVSKAEIDAWSEVYVERELSAMRGGRRRKAKQRVREDVTAAFPGIGWWLLFITVRYIWNRLND